MTNQKMPSRAKKYRHRKKYEVLSAEVIAEIPDDELDWAVMDCLWYAVKDDYDRLNEVLNELPVGYRAFYAIQMIENEVKNGGYNQYFWNGHDAEAALASLRLIHADKHIINFEKAIKLYKEDIANPEFQNLIDKNTLKSFAASYKLTKLKECDKEFYQLDQELIEARARFIRQNMSLFVRPSK